MPEDVVRIIRAACGDATSLTVVARSYAYYNERAIALLSVIVLSEPDPHPLAALIALSAHNRPPDALRAIVRRALPVAMSILEHDACSDLRAALVLRLPHVWDALAHPLESETIAVRNCLAQAANDARAAADLLERIGVEGWALMSPDAQTNLLRRIARSSKTAARGGGKVWRAFGDQERSRVARSAAREPRAAADLLERIGPEGWTLAPPEARAALLQAICADAEAAARGGAVWAALAPEARARVAHVAARHDETAADLLERIGPEGWKQTPMEARAALLQAICADAEAAARGGGAVWTALGGQERSRVARSAARAAADLLERIGPEGWALATAAARETLLRRIVRLLATSAVGVGAIWTALSNQDRRRVARIAARAPCAAADLLERIGAAGWTPTSAAVQAMLLQALEADPYAAARGGAAVWSALDTEARARVARWTGTDAYAASILLESIETTGWEQTPPAARETLLQALESDPYAAARGGAAVWSALDTEARARVVTIAARRDATASDLLARIGPEGWALAPPEARETLLQAICADPESAAYGGGKVWMALAPDDRRRIAQSAARNGRFAVDLLNCIGAEGWALAPPEARETLQQAIETEPACAACGGGAVWASLNSASRARIAQSASDAWSVADLLNRIGAEGWALAPPEARETLLQSAGSHAGAAAHALLILGDALDDNARMRLLRAALSEDPEDHGSRAVAQALADGYAWRKWMEAFAPDAGTDVDTVARWRAVLHRLPAAVAARLLFSRAQRR